MRTPVWVLLVLLAGCKTPPPVVQPINPATVAIAVEETACAKVAADATWLVPKSFPKDGHYVPSPSGGYGYRHNCPFWVVDFALNSESHTFDNPPSKEWTRFTGVAYDLPSSPSTAEGLSGDPEDCNRLWIEYYVYQRYSLEAGFDTATEWPPLHTVLKGEYDALNQVCGVTSVTDFTDAQAPPLNLWWVRVAVRVRERNTWQEAAAFAFTPPPR